MDDLRLVAFDFDGTLTDYLAADRAAIAAAQRLCDYTGATGTFFEVSGEAIMTFHALVEEGRVDPLHMHAWRLRETCRLLALGPPPPQAVATYRQTLIATTAPLDEAVTVLAALRTAGPELAIITNAYDPDEQRHRIDHAFPDEPFDHVVVAGEHGRPKPHRDAFDELLERVGISGAHAAYVGDLPNYDVPGAHQAGMRTVVVNRDPGARRKGAALGAAVLPTLSDLPQLLTGFRASEG